MVDNNRYFYISGLISLSLFTFFAYMMVFTLFKSNKMDIYALKKDNYISISLDTPKQPTATKKTNPISINQDSSLEQNEVNIDDLFSDVWTKNINKPKKKKKQTENKRLQEVLKKSKKIDKSSNEKNLNKIDNQIVNKNDKSFKESTAMEVNEYFAKIQALVYNNFHPQVNMYGYVVQAVIELNSIGKMTDFRILSYSANSSLNTECDNIKGRLMRVLFPINPQNKSQTIIINLIPENKE